MQNCIKCKAPLPEDALFCPACGKRQEAAPRKHRKRANGSGAISKLSGNRAKPWMARKNGVMIGTFSTRAEAQKALERITDVSVTEKYNLTLQQVYDRWHAEHSRNIAEKTLKDYEWAFKLCAPLHDRKIRSILRSDYQALIIAQEVKGRSKGTCNKVRVVLGMLGRWAYEEGITLSNNADNLNTSAKQLSTRETFLKQDVKALKKTSLPASDIALILISCGCRPGELFKVPVADCFDDYFIGGSKTEAGKDRVIPIGPDGLAAYTKLRCEAIAKGEPLLISGYKGSHVYANFAKRDWKKLMEEIGRPGYTPYVCRHTFITNAIRSGVDLPVLEAIVGHLDRETTRIYTHLRAEDLVDAVQGLDAEKTAVCNRSVTRSSQPEQNAPIKLAK
ncbi:MAG: tyrosine-type recombinase/integrase [Oscillospiraceae bacterium]|nr:tyrosine-type recombinase/integrase [Oscillospiraceae bacterium]